MLTRNNIKKWLKQEAIINPHEKILLGFSGGSDSVALCHILASLRQELNFSLDLIYIQHNLRGEESIAEESFVCHWAEQYNCPIRVVSVDVIAKSKAEKKSIETAARELRHNAFKQILEKENYNRVALAHHGKDQAETVLMHFLRGSGVDGLAAMRKVEGIYLRPLLDYSKIEIENYLKKEQISWCEDSSNLDINYRRNKVRHELLPYLEKNFNPNLIHRLGESARQMQDLQDYLNPFIEDAFKQVYRPQNKEYQHGVEHKTVVLEVDGLRAMPAYLQQMVIRRAFIEAKGSSANLEHNHIKRGVSLLEKNHGKREDLVDGWQIRKSYGNLIFERKFEQSPLGLRKQENIELRVGLDRIKGKRYIKIIKDLIVLASILNKDSKNIKYKKGTEFFDYLKLPSNLVLRNPREKDYICINKQGNKKKLKDFLSDQKIPPRIRSQILVLASGREVIWVIGYRIGYPYRITETTEQVCKLTILGRTVKCQKLKKEFQKKK